MYRIKLGNTYFVIDTKACEVKPTHTPQPPHTGNRRIIPINTVIDYAPFDVEVMVV